MYHEIVEGTDMRYLPLLLLATACRHPADSGGPDASKPGGDAPGGADASADAEACAAPPPGGTDLTVDGSWSAFDTTPLGASTFAGAAFDGRFLYFAPYESTEPSSPVARYDTQKAFGETGSWTTFLTGMNQGFAGVVFDGRYVYLVPAYNAPVERYDTHTDFTLAGSWGALTMPTGAGVFQGGAFDGRYIYFSPFSDSGGLSNGLATRYDTQNPGFQTFDATAVDANAYSFIGAAFDGRYVYYPPAHDEQGVPGGIAARFDTQGDFTTSAAWSSKDLTTVDPRLKGLRSAVFDGRYMYFVPNHDGPGDDGVIARYDTQGNSFDNGWSVFDASTLDPDAVGFIGGVFDGRYVYFAPFGHSTVARYDTMGGFGCASAWQTYSTTALGTSGFYGAAFDGENVYFVPVESGVVARFHAWDTAMPVTTSHGSFF